MKYSNRLIYFCIFCNTQCSTLHMEIECNMWVDKCKDFFQEMMKSSWTWIIGLMGINFWQRLSIFKNLQYLKIVCRSKWRPTNQMRTSKGYLYRACYSKGVSHHHLYFAKTQRQAEEWEDFIVEKKQAPGVPWLEATGQGNWRLLTGSRASYVIRLDRIFGFLWLILSWKQGQKLGKLSVINQVLDFWGWTLQRLFFNFLHWLLERVAWLPIGQSYSRLLSQTG